MKKPIKIGEDLETEGLGSSARLPPSTMKIP